MNEHVNISEFNVESILDERRKVHGDFADHAHITQRLKTAMRGDVFAKSNYPHGLTHSMIEALEMIQHKVGRILAGDPNHIDHWDDIAGYATLVAKGLRRLEAGGGDGC